MRAPARLAVEPDDLDDAYAAIGRRRRRHRAASDQSGLSADRLGRHPLEAQRQVLADHVVELWLQRA